MRLVMASIFQVEDIQKAPVIHKAVLCCIFLSSLKGWDKETLLKYHNGRPYRTMGRTHVFI